METIVPAALVYDVAGAAEALGVSQASVYAAVKAHTLPSFRLGRRVLIPKAALLKLLETSDKGPVCGLIGRKPTEGEPDE